MPRVSFTIRIDPQLLALLKHLARRQYRTTSALIQLLLRRAIDNKLHK